MRRLLYSQSPSWPSSGLAPPAMAQAPARRSRSQVHRRSLYVWQNLSDYDLDYHRQKDTQATGRTRGRFDIIGEVGKAKASSHRARCHVRQTGNNDTFLDTGTT